jgi:hypothetical protein
MNLSQAMWRKSSRSGGNGGSCVEVATNLADLVAIRDSKLVDVDGTYHGPVLTVVPAEWRAFLSTIQQ